MRERNLLYLFLVLNVALGGAFVTYLYLSHSGPPDAVLTRFPDAAKTNAATNALAALAALPPRTNLLKTNLVAAALTNSVEAKTNSVAVRPPAKPRAAWSNKKFGWPEVEADDYPGYLESLRAVGCPEEKVRSIVLGDINELFARKKQKAAIESDYQWWRSEFQYFQVPVLQEKGRQLEEQRRELIARLLGEEVATRESGEALIWGSVQLTGPVLGNLAPKSHNEVQEICQRSLERQQSYRMARFTQAQPESPVEMARLREATRSDLRKILNPEEVEEFVLRYSFNAHQLRMELAALDPTAEEFRKIFRGLDPIEHQMQLEYGSVDAMSEKQRERHIRLRDSAIKESLAPERYLGYLTAKDPLYVQARTMAQQYGASPRAVMPIYQMTKLNEEKRQKIRNDAGLTQEQKVQAIGAVDLEQRQTLQKIMMESAVQR